MTAASPANTAATSSNPKANLEGFLCGDLEAVPALEVLRARRLEAWAYTVLPTGHPLKATCKSAFITARARHELIKQEVLEMVRAWNAAGIEPVLYKGFALAEFTYPQPGTRFHGDVDVLVRPEDFRRALEVGHERGWETPQPFDHWLFNNPNPHELPLKQAQANAAFDVHQRLVPTLLRSTMREQAMTQMAWANSRQVEWQGTRIRLLSPEDAFVFGLVISRCWSGDGWRLKSHDLLDGLALIRQGLTRETVLARATSLNVSGTVNAFLARCDPFQPNLKITHPSTLEYLTLEWRTAGEHRPLLFAQLFHVLLATPSFLKLTGFLPLFFAVQNALQRQPDLQHALEKLEIDQMHARRPTMCTSLIWWLNRRLKRTLSLDWPVMVYIALRGQGQQVTFKLGERNGLQRAWVEVNAKVLPEFVLEHGPLEEFKVLLTRT
jgi:Uncharacterised nucleotidyltransferase